MCGLLHFLELLVRTSFSLHCLSQRCVSIFHLFNLTYSCFVSIICCPSQERQQRKGFLWLSSALFTHVGVFTNTFFFISPQADQAKLLFKPISNVKIFRKHYLQVPVCMFTVKQGFFLWPVCFLSGIVFGLTFVCATLSAYQQQINYRHIQNSDGFNRPNSLDKCTSTLQLTDERHQLEFTCMLLILYSIQYNIQSDHFHSPWNCAKLTMQVSLNFGWNWKYGSFPVISGFCYSSAGWLDQCALMVRGQIVWHVFLMLWLFVFR